MLSRSLQTSSIHAKRLFPSRRAFSDLPSRFEQAVSALQSSSPSVPKKEVSNATKLRLYALYKQAQSGDCTGTRPGLFDPVGRAKYDAWLSLRGSVDREQAMEKYVATVTEIFDGQLPAVVAGKEESANKSVNASPAPNKTNTNSAHYQPRSMAEIAFPRKSLSGKTEEGSLPALATINYAVDRAAGIASIALNRSKRGNSFNLAMWEDLHETWRRVNGDEHVKVAILRGEGANFSTGMDLSVFVDFQRLLGEESCEGRRREAVGAFIEYLQTAISGAEDSPIPVIAAVHGQCIGGAIDLICSADLRFCTKDAVFSVKEIDLAIVADIGTLQRLPKLIGLQRAAELAYTARTFTGAEAEAWGLVAKTFDSKQEMDDYVAKVAQGIAKKSPLTVRGTKRTLLYARDHSVSEALKQVKLWNSAHLLSNDLAEAALAIMQKRAPDFKDM